MKIIPLVVLLSCCSVKEVRNLANSNYRELLLTLFEHFLIKQSLILEDLKLPETSIQIKIFSRMKVATAVVSFEEFSKLAKEKHGIYSNIAVVVNLSNESQIDQLLQYSRLISDIGITWMVLVAPGIKTFTNRIHVPIYCQFLIIKPVDDSTFLINEFFSLKHLREEQLWGNWSTETKLSVNVEKPLFRRRQNLKKVSLIALDIPFPYLQLKFWGYLMQFYNLTYLTTTIQEIALTGVRPDAILMNTAFHFNSFSRDLVGPLGTTSYYLYIKKPTEDKSFWTSYFQPFMMDAWVVVILFTILISILILLLKITLLKMAVQQTNERFDPVGYGCFTFDTMMGQSGMGVPSKTSFRIAFFATTCFAALLQRLYGGELISYLTTHKFPLPFSDMTGLVEDGTYNITFYHDKGHMTSLLLNSSGSVSGDYVRSHRTEIPTQEKMLNIICNEKVVLASDSGNDLNGLFAWPCEIIRVPRPFAKVHTALYLTDDSELTSAFRFKLPWFRESGILNCFHRRRPEYFGAILTSQYKNRAPDLTEVDLPRIMPAFVLLLLGIASSVCVSLLERLYYSRHCSIAG